MSRRLTALLSACNKAGLEDFARELVRRDWDILASGGTAKYLAERGIQARDVADIVGPPILGHRVVTLSREIHAALLAEDTEKDNLELARIGVPRIDLVYVDLYPLEATIAKPGVTLQEVIEKTDIGGPTMLRSAAKGRRIVVSNTAQFDEVLQFIDDGGILGTVGSQSKVTEDYIEGKISVLAASAEDCVSRYCRASAVFLQGSSLRSFMG